MERSYFDGLKSERRRQSYLAGRFAAKQALAAAGGLPTLAEILIGSGVFWQPVVECEGLKNMQVSISHCDDVGIAIAFPERYPMGIDIESINPEKCDVLQAQVTAGEREQLHLVALSEEEGLTVLWTAKEALSKVLRTGFTVALEALEVSKVMEGPEYLSCHYKLFPLYRCITFIVSSYVIAVALPKNVDFTVDWADLKLSIRVLLSG
ncbi:MAG TPA: 4'-phosphopantetheinyl transferase superfamily protein [Symbiobacteriaceae bacterium]